MLDSTWQTKKKKLLTRLSIAIYKMSDEQLVSLLHLFMEMSLYIDQKQIDIDDLQETGPGDQRTRQMLIAKLFLLINHLSETQLQQFINRSEEKQLAIFRDYPRVACNFMLDLASDGRAANCFARDISANGIFVESCELFTMGQRVSMCFTLDDSRLSLKLKGNVVRLEHGGAGIKYEALTTYQSEIMEDIVRHFNN
jgi:hypothetical protein